MLYILFMHCDSWICCTLLNNIYSQTSICCECPQRFFCILTSILKAKIVNIQRQTLLECRKELFIWMFEGQNIWNAQKTPKKSTDNAVEKQLKPSVFLRLDGCFFPNFISVECVYSHSGLKERKCEEKNIPQRLNCIFYTVKLHLEHHSHLIEIFPSMCGVNGLSVSELFRMVFSGERSQRYFSPLAALHLVND